MPGFVGHSIRAKDWKERFHHASIIIRVGGLCSHSPPKLNEYAGSVLVGAMVKNQLDDLLLRMTFIVSLGERVVQIQKEILPDEV